MGKKILSEIPVMKPYPKPEPKEKKKQVRWINGVGYSVIRQRSERRAKEERIYHTKTKPKYLKDNPICKVCTIKKATTIHHKRGRIGNLLNDIKYFLGCCIGCHRKIEDNPEWAKKMGYSENRLI